MITVTRYRDDKYVEIMLDLPQGESYIMAERLKSGRYDLGVYLPGYGFAGGDSLILYEELDDGILDELMTASTSDLIRIIRHSLPALKRLDRSLNYEM